MSFQWLAQSDPATAALHLRPHRSLSSVGFVWFIGLTAALLALPLIPQLGTPVLWALLPFLSLAVAGIWLALRLSYRTATEDLTLSPTAITLTRHDPGKTDQTWAANPYWVRVMLHPTGGPVPDYLTLSGSGRVVELGAFLTPMERRDLHELLLKRLSAIRALPPAP
jgi:uncharacterized membrane protein